MYNVVNVIGYLPYILPYTRVFTTLCISMTFTQVFSPTTPGMCWKPSRSAWQMQLASALTQRSQILQKRSSAWEEFWMGKVPLRRCDPCEARNLRRFKTSKLRTRCCPAVIIGFIKPFTIDVSTIIGTLRYIYIRYKPVWILWGTTFYNSGIFHI